MTLKKFLNNFEEYFCVWTLAIMTIVVFVQVVMRYVFANSLSWSEELARFIFLWFSWVGASYAVRERSHFRVEMLVDLFKGASRIWIEYLVLLIWSAFSFFLTWYGTKLVLFIRGAGQVSAAMRMPMTWPYAAVPAGCALMCVRLVVELWKLHKNGLSHTESGEVRATELKPSGDTTEPLEGGK